MPSLDKGGEVDFFEDEPSTAVNSQQVREYLSSNPQFFKEWLQSHCDQQEIQNILDEHLSKRQQQQDDVLDYHERSRGGRNSVTTEIFNSMTNGRKRSSSHRSVHRLRDDAKAMDDSELFMTLIRDISNELDVDTLCHKILVNVSLLTNSDRSSLFLAKGSRNNRYLIPQLFDVTVDSELQDQENLPDIKIPFGVGIAGHVAKTKESIIIKDAYQDQRFNKAVDKQTGYKTVSIMCKPICNNEGEVIGVAQIINKHTGDHEFTDQDEEVFERYLTFCGIGIQNAQLFELSVLEYKRNQLMLSLAKGIFEEQSDLEKLIREIMTKASKLIPVERCGVYLIDDKQTDGEIVFGTALELRYTEEEIVRPDIKEMTESSLMKVAKEVVSTGQHLNKDVSEDDLLVSDVDDVGLEVQSVLVMPIYDGESKVIGAAMLINKADQTSFNLTDVSTFEAFAIFCGLGIHNAQMYDKACKLMAKQKVALEVLSFHATATLDESKQVLQSHVQSAEFFDLYDFGFNDFKLSDDQTVHATIRMFLEWDIHKKFHVPYEVLCKWILSVRKNYRPVIYHNWRHALNVAQTMFAMLTTGNMMQFVTQLEAFALIVACLCHDLDHRGTNNTFQTKTESALAQLYGTSTMEHHHFDQCIMILNSEGNNIFQSLSSDDYRMVIHLIEAAIISTDLALYFKKKGKFIELVDKNDCTFKISEDRELLRAMMMTACDVSAITKPWEIQKVVADLVSSEFFEQGDMEKNQLNEEPIAMMDREKRDELPKMQVGFIDFICMPVYKAFSEMNIALLPLYDGVQNNRKEWKKLDDIYQQKLKDGTLQNEENLVKANGKVKEIKEEQLVNEIERKVSTSEKRSSIQKLLANTDIRRKTMKSKACVIL